MKPMKTLLLALTTAALAATAALAQPRMGDGGGDEDRPRPARRRDGTGERPGREGQGSQDPSTRGRRPGPATQPAEAPPPRLEEVLRQLDLNERQREQIGQILREAREQGRGRRTEDAQAQREAAEALRQARRDGDDETAEKARRQLQALRDRRQETLLDVRQQIEAVLSPQQREHLARLMGPGGRFDAFLEALKAIDLQPAQKRQIREIAAEADAKAKTQTDNPEKVRIYPQAHEKIMALLTDEQKEALRRQIASRERHRQTQAMFANLDLTADQRQAIEKIQAEVRQKVDNADSPQAQREALREGQRRIVTEVLTDEQRRQLRQQMQERLGPGGERAPREGGPGPGGDRPAPPRDDAGD
jgi:Spy/CpxP family protein refolding chaperone